MVLVKHYRLHNNSSDIDSKSVKYQYYHPEVYDEYVREDEENGKFNSFVRMGLKTEVIHNPERDADGLSVEKYEPIKKQAAAAPKSAAPAKTPEQIKAEKKLADEKQKEADEKKRLADEAEAEKLKFVFNRYITINGIEFAVNKNAYGYAAIEKAPKDAANAITGKGTTLKELSSDIEKQTAL